MVTICDHLSLLFSGQLEHEIGREPSRISPNLLIQLLGADLKKLRQVSVQHDLLTPDQQDPLVDSVDETGWNSFLGHGASIG